MELIRTLRVPARGLLMTAALCMLIPVALTAQVAEGKIEGYVRDADTGQPLAGAQVMVEGTNLGNVTNRDGYYFILNVPPGLRTITATYTGYQKTSVENQRIMAGHTSTINFQLSSTVIDIEGIVIEGEANPLLARDNVQTRQNITTEETAEVPVDDLNSIIGMQAGVRQQGDFSFTIRGGRQNEEAIYVDGVLTRNFSTGLNNMSPADNSSMVKVSPDAIEEVSIITGGFQAEYGNAQSGVVNIVTRGGGERFRGSVSYKTDEILPESSSYGYNLLRGSLGGPLWGNVNFFASLEMRGSLDPSPRKGEKYGRFEGISKEFYEGFDRLLGGYLTDNGIGLNDLPNFDLPDRGARVGLENDEYIFGGKVNVPFGEKVSTLFSFNQNRNQGMDFDLQNNLINMPGRTAGFNKTKTGVLGFDWDMVKRPTSSYSLRMRLSGYENDLHDGPVDPTWAGGNQGALDLEHKVQKFGFGDYEFLYGDLYDKMSAEDVEAKYGEINRWQDNLPASYAVGNSYWGWGVLVPEGTSVNVLNQKERNATIKVDLDAQVDRYNRMKMGVDAKIIHINALNLTNYGGLLSSEAQNYYDAHPMLFSAYVQDRVDVGDFVLDFGLRWDRMDPRAHFAAEAGMGPAGEQVPAPVRNVVSPRIGVAHPITDRTQFRFSYGHFYQPPPFDLMFTQKNIQSKAIWSPTGDKDLDFSKTSAFEVGFSSLLTNDLILDVVGYYRDFEGNIAIRYWVPSYESAPMPFYANQDYGNAKGVDVTLKKRMLRYLNFNVSYSLQVARGTGSTPDFFRRPDRLTNVVTGEYIEPPVRFWPVGNDRTHYLTGQFNLRLPSDWQQDNALGTLLGSTSYYLIQGFGTGGFAGIREPEALSGGVIPLIDENSLRGKSSKWTHLRATKRFMLSGNVVLSGFLEVRNLIQWDSKYHFNTNGNQLNAIQNELTQGIGVTGTQYIGSYTTDPVDAYVDNPDAVAVAALRDFNNDGAISRAEQFVAEQLNTSIARTWDGGGSARLWRFGLEFNF